MQMSQHLLCVCVCVCVCVQVSALVTVQNSADVCLPPLQRQFRVLYLMRSDIHWNERSRPLSSVRYHLEPSANQGSINSLSLNSVFNLKQKKMLSTVCPSACIIRTVIILIKVARRLTSAKKGSLKNTKFLSCRSI